MTSIITVYEKILLAAKRGKGCALSDEECKAFEDDRGFMDAMVARKIEPSVYPSQYGYLSEDELGLMAKAIFTRPA